MTKNVLVTGCTGMVGSHLLDLLIEEGHWVTGLVRKASTFPTERIAHLLSEERLTLRYGDVTDPLGMTRLLDEVEPDEIYHLAALSHVGVSFELPLHTGAVTGLGTTVLLEAARQVCRPATPFYNAATSELFGNEPAPQSEETPINPASPYAAAKAYGYHMARVYREAYGMHVTNGILFNQTSHRQSPTFVTRKITRGVARIVHKLDAQLVLGNLIAARDLTWAADGARAITMMLRASEPDDWVVASGTAHPVSGILRRAVYEALETLDADEVSAWIGKHVVPGSAQHTRPLEVDELCGDATKIEDELGWEPEFDFSDIIANMVAHDMKLARLEADHA